MKKVSIIAATFYGNRGAEGMLSTTIGKLREHYNVDLGFNVFTYYPQRDRELINDRNISIYSSTPTYLVLVLFPCSLLYRFFGLFKLNSLQYLLPDSVRALAQSKVLVCLAGVSFVEGRTKFIPFNIATILPAMILSVPVVKFAQAMGPFTSQLNRFSAKLFLGRCRQVFTRGEKTHSYLKELLGDKAVYQRADDVAFLFRPEYCISLPSSTGVEKKLVDLNSMRLGGNIIVGVCPSVVIAKRAEIAGWNYTKRMQELVTGLVELGYAVALYPNATRGEDMDKIHNNDLPLLINIINGLELRIKKQVIGFTGSYNAAEIHKIINACDVQAVSRFHAMVASLASAVPVMVIGWSHKYLEVMERFEQQDMVLDYKKGSIDPIIDCVNRLISERVVRSAKIIEALPAVEKLSKRQIDYTVQILKSNS